MSLMRVCAEAEAVIGRARALFGPLTAVQVPAAGTQLETAAAAMSAARSRTVGLRGSGMGGYRAVSPGLLSVITRASRADDAVVGYLAEAVALHRAGVHQLDRIVAVTAALVRVAPAADSVASQRMMLVALRSQVSQTARTVGSTEQHCARVGRHLRSASHKTTHSPDDRVSGLPPVPEADVPYEPPPPPAAASVPGCYIGTEDGRLGDCSPDTPFVDYFDAQGRYVRKTLSTGEVEILAEGNTGIFGSQTCVLPSSDADRSGCAPGTVDFIYPDNGSFVEVEPQPDGSVKILFDNPPGTPLAP